MRPTRWTLLAAGVLLGVLVAVPPTPAGAAPGTDAAVPPLVALGGAGNLDHGWVASFTYDYTIPTPVAPTITYDTGTTGVAGSTSPNVLDGTMTSQGRTFSVQASLPVGQTIAAGRSYQSDLDGAAIQVTWPGGGCASSAYGGGDWFAIDLIGRTAGGVADQYAIRFLCVSPNGAVTGAFAYDLAPDPPGQGFYTYGADGSTSGSGNNNYLTYLGSLEGTALAQPIVGMAITPDGRGYWMVASDGGVFAFGDASFYGSMGGTPLNEPIVGMARTADGGGYWLVASDGGIFAFGDARFAGSMGGRQLNQPIVGMTSSPGGGYRLVASDGGIFSFGAPFYGSTGGTPLNQPIVGMTGTHDGGGYWMVASDGGIFAFGDASFHGSTGSIPLNAPIVGMASTADDAGYWLAAADGGVFAFGDAPYFGSPGLSATGSAVGIAS